ncbi:ATP-grasp domain-containing protein [Paenibacillus sp. S-38]|uniref:ATP-grasp domain-containing protein n=1 Tax=Paenibacillus sp. S-38 TaxID=3416710 RepID=UPI003CF1E1CF
MRILFCADPMDSRTVDCEYAHEYEAAKRQGFEVDLISLQELLLGRGTAAVRRVADQEEEQQALYRGWMMKPEKYRLLDDVLRRKNIRLLTSPEAYRQGHYFPYSYDAVSDLTPRSIWVDAHELEHGLDRVHERLQTFAEQGIRSLLIKDFVKSRKHEWEDACYIPDMMDRGQVERVLGNFISRQGEDLNGGVVFREFVLLEQAAVHPKSGMPLANEYRLFFLHHRLLTAAAYWDELEYRGQELPDLTRFQEAAERIPSPFFTMDIARIAEGKWLIIEIGDGGVSGLPAHCDANDFYRELRARQ